MTEKAKHCLVCGQPQFEAIYRKTLLKCTTCGFVTANISIDADEVGSIYTARYFRGGEYQDYVADKQVIQRNFRRKVKRALMTVPRSSIRRALEIGCAHGFFGEVLKETLENVSYLGVDVAEEAIQYGKTRLNLDLHCGDYLDLNLPGPFTDVFMWDVIEHLERPDAYLARVFDDLEAAGRVYITTGDIGALLPRMQGRRWRMIHPPSHLHYFSADTLARLLTAKGFRIVDQSYPAVFRSIRQIYYSLFLLRRRGGRLTSSIYRSIPSRLSMPLNTFDIMFVIAEKAGR